MWDAIREFLGAVVSFFYGLVPNLGVAIILLTVAVGVVLFPLTLKQTRSMRAMQVLQPELKRLQKEYAGDKPGLQQATLALYKQRGVNPAAGCLPLLLQMPVWFALFQVLQSFSASPMSLGDECAGQRPVVAPGGSFACSYSGFVVAEEAGHQNRVTANIADSGGRAATRTDTATVMVGQAGGEVTATIRPAAGVVGPGGGRVGFTVEVVNPSAQAVTLEGMTDSVFGDLLAVDNDLAGANTCPAQERRILPGGALACGFEGFVPGGPTTHQNILSASLRDEAGESINRTDTAEVGLGDVAPGVAVVVRPAAGAVPPEGRVVRFQVEVVNGTGETVTVTAVGDDRFGNLTSPGSSPTRFLKMVEGGRLYNDIQAWLEAGRRPADPAWRAFAGMNLSNTPRDAFGLGVVAFLPYLATLLLVMGTAYYQQRQTMPKAKDGQATPQMPGQAVLKFFPILFGFISYTLPAGLGVYFAASAVFRIGQQSLIIRLSDRQAGAKAMESPGDGETGSEAATPKALEPRTPKAAARPARAQAVQPRGGSGRSPQASQQRGKKRRRR